MKTPQNDMITENKKWKYLSFLKSKCYNNFTAAKKKKKKKKWIWKVNKQWIKQYLFSSQILTSKLMSTGLGWGNVRLLWLYIVEWSKEVGVTDVKELWVPFTEWRECPVTLETGLGFLPEIDDPGDPDFWDLPWIWK